MSAAPTDKPAPRRGRPPRITPGEILDAAGRRLESGWTMAGIASDLGVSEPTIYYYFPTREALVVALSERIFDQLVLPEPKGDWQAWLTDVSQTLVELGIRHPFLHDVDLAIVTAGRPRSVELLEKLLEPLVASGFSASDAATALGLVLTLAAEHSRSAVTTRARTPDLAQRAQLGAGAGDLPVVRKLYATDEIWDADAGFRKMLAVAIAGIAAELAPATERPAR